MAGDQLHGYDAVLELAEATIERMVATFIDDNDVPCALLEGLGIPAGIDCESFTVSVRLDRPTDVSVPPDVSTLDITLDVGDATNGMTSRFVVGLDVVRDLPDVDVVMVDFRDMLYHVDMTVRLLGVEQPLPPSLNDVVKAAMPPAVLLPAPVDRGSSSPTVVRAVDAFAVDDTSTANRDALALAFTFGGGTAGSRSAFTRSFIPDGREGALGVGQHWLCRVIGPPVETGIGLPAGSFADCDFSGSVTVRSPDGDEGQLTRLTLTAQDGHLELFARVTASGFCWSGTGTVRARIFIEVVGGELRVRHEVDDPDVDASVDWICILVGAIIGAIIGAVIGAVIGGIVGAIVGGIIGAIIGGLVTWLAAGALTGTVEEIADALGDLLDTSLPEVAVPLAGLDLVPVEAFIDDVTVAYRVRVNGFTPLHHEGEVTLRPGQGVDLDRGLAQPANGEGVDLWMDGAFLSAAIRPGCGAMLAPTGSRDLLGLARYDVRNLDFQPGAVAGMGELAQFGFGFPPGLKPSRRVFGVMTDEDRFGVWQVVDVGNFGEWVRLRYRVWAHALEGVRIDGGFSCLSPLLPSTAGDVLYAPPAHVAGADHDCPPATPEASTLAPAGQKVRLTTTDVYRLTGGWRHRAWLGAREVGVFRAIVTGRGAVSDYTWELDGRVLEGETGTVQIGSSTVDYKVDGAKVELRPKQREPFEAWLKVTAWDERERRVSSGVCARFEPQCPTDRRAVPDLAAFLERYQAHTRVQVDVSPEGGAPVRFAAVSRG